MIKEHKIDEHTIIYQTNCLYTAEGQIIIARQLAGNLVFFMDCSRGLDGGVNCALSATAIQEEYLNNRYRHLDARYKLRVELEELVKANKHHVPCTR